MAGRLVALTAVALAVHWHRLTSQLVPAPTLAYLEEVAAEVATTMLLVLAAWLASASAAAALRRVPGTLGLAAERAWRLLVPTALRMTVVTLAGATVALPAHALDDQAAVPVVGRPTTAVPVDGRDPSVGAIESSTLPSTAAPPPSGPPRSTTVARSAAVTVRPGDCLWTIAARHLGGTPTAAQVAEHWPRWYQANRQAVGDDPDLIHPGIRLVPPPSPSKPAVPSVAGLERSHP